MPRPGDIPDEPGPAALSWALAQQVQRLRGSATDAMIIQTSLGVFGGVLPAWSVEAGTPFVVTEGRIPGGWLFMVGPAAERAHVTVAVRGPWWDPEVHRGRRRIRTALRLIAHGTGDTPKWADAWADAWGVAVWTCARLGCERRFRHYAQVARHERRIHGRGRSAALSRPEPATVERPSSHEQPQVADGSSVGTG